MQCWLKLVKRTIMIVKEKGVIAKEKKEKLLVQRNRP